MGLLDDTGPLMSLGGSDSERDDEMERGRLRDAEQDQRWAETVRRIREQQNGGQNDAEEEGEGGDDEDSPQGLGERERQGDTKRGEEGKQDDSRGNSGDDQSSSNEEGGSGEGGDKSLYTGKGGKGQKGKARSFLAKHKLALAAASGGFLLVLLIIFILQLGSLVIPNFTNHMIAWHFSRVGRHLMNTSNAVTSEKIALDSASDSLFKRTFPRITKLGSNVGTRINAWRPQKVANAVLDGTKYNYTSTYTVTVPGVGPVQRQKLTSIEFPDGRIVQIPENLNAVGRLNPYKYVKSYTQFRRDTTGLVAKGSWVRNWTVRVKAAKEIRVRIGSKLFRWSKADLEKSKKMTNDQALVDETKRSYNIASDRSRLTASSTQGAIGDVEEAAKHAVEEQAACMNDDDCVAKVVQSQDGVAPAARQTIEAKFKPTPISSVIGGVSATYDILVPMCLVYQASVQNSGGLIDANIAQSENTFNGVASASDSVVYTQLKPDDPRVNATSYNALVNQINGDNGDGDGLYQGSVEKHARGDTVDTSTTASAEGGGAGVTRYDILDWLGIGFLSGAFNGICTVFADPFGGAVIVGSELLASVIPGAGQAAKLAGTATAKFVSVQIGKQIGKLVVKSLTKRELGKLALVAGATTAAAYLAEVITSTHAGMAYNGAAQGESFSEQASAGGNAMANQTCQYELMCAPMTTDALRQTTADDDDFNTDIVKAEPFSQRYFALHNPDSLINHVAMAGYSHLNLQSVSSFLASLGNFFSPSGLAGLFSAILPARAHAAEIQSIDQNFYGNVQFGWTKIEENAYLNDPDYGMANNQEQLDASGALASIVAKYGKCFDPNVSMGTLLADGDIRRDENSNVLDMPDDAVCSPSNLGPISVDGQGKLKFRSPEAANVFRWRVAVRNDNGLHEMESIQNAAEAPRP